LLIAAFVAGEGQGTGGWCSGWVNRILVYAPLCALTMLILPPKGTCFDKI
jgi:hypothetical protein